MSALDMVRTGERFYTSLGFEPLPKTFWERSLFVRPRDREVVCHASAWDIDTLKPTSASRCASSQTAEDFTTIHHELGHNFYQRAYKDLPVLFRDSANDGFHEAIGDTIALSVTPEYLVKIGLLDKAPDASRDIGLLMTRALEKVAFLPFGLLIDQWRWKVFCRRGAARRLQQGVVGSAAEVSGRCAAVGARRGVLRSGREVSRAGQHAVHALLPRRHPAVPVPSRALEDRRLHDAAASLLDLREQGSGPAAERDAVDGAVAPVAGRARGAHRIAPDGRDGDHRLLRAAQDVARRADEGQTDGLVASMDAFLTSDGLLALVTLTFLEVILGVDNVIFISILSGKLPAAHAVEGTARTACSPPW